ncbi:membrane progestin receptor gamma-B isoform X2 [Pseudoliparis swirei]|uniref:membrane progestin receptor gamma-B isoform X2 n=1 Tax=Pseudoliparis swirei TaxID=2059687 RepID=UPI0024BE99F0|nr:membrane progestin receptor gamma-B isoform X2 [Pseudoliparis swirei]
MLSLIKLPQLFTINQVPKVFHEDSIYSGYRHPHSSATDCILSLFQLTNETVNIWTHFLPTWYFLWEVMAVVLVQTAWHDSFIWPLVIFLLSCCIYPLASSCAHTFSSMSGRARHICFFFDYAALSFYSLGSAIVYSAYVFPDKWVNGLFHRCYVPLAVLNTVICTGLACYSRFPEYQNPKFSKYLRVVAFAYPYFFDHVPLFYRVCMCEGEGCSDNGTNMLHVTHITLALLTGFLFATHLPERLAPGSFDYIGHSHQLFHVCSILGTHFQMKAVKQDMVTRRPWLLAHSVPITFANSVGAALLCVAANVAILTLYSLPLLSAPDGEDKKHDKGGKKASTRACLCS